MKNVPQPFPFVTAGPDRHRRKFLRQSGALATASLLAGCVSAPPATYPRPLSSRPFARPHVESTGVAFGRVGLRPFRTSGFVVRSERLGEKTVVHNYGHDGAGITLSWGSSTLAVDEAPDLADRRAAVLGCGVMGLTTARLLQQRGWKVTIYARDLPPNTTSNVAGGFWAPTSVFGHDGTTPQFDAQLDRAVKISHDVFAAQVGAGYGVSWIENYYLRNRPFGADDYYYLHNWPRLFPGIAELSPNQHPFPASHVLTHLTMLIEPAIFLPRLMNDFLISGGNIVVRHMGDRAELASLAEPLLFNCAGLGAKTLFDDAELTPVRGQLVFLPPDERVDYCMHGGGPGLLYMFPRKDGILLGGSYDKDDSRMEPDPEISARIIAGYARIAAAMRV